jgi:hypothetical protein
MSKTIIAHDIDGETQQSSFMNSTLQTCATIVGDVDVSIAIYLNPPRRMLNQYALGTWIDGALSSLPEGFTAEVQISNPEED